MVGVVKGGNSLPPSDIRFHKKPNPIVRALLKKKKMTRSSYRYEVKEQRKKCIMQVQRQSRVPILHEAKFTKRFFRRGWSKLLSIL